jgi:hypothetical protein
MGSDVVALLNLNLAIAEVFDRLDAGLAQETAYTFCMIPTLFWAFSENCYTLTVPLALFPMV